MRCLTICWRNSATPVCICVWVGLLECLHVFLSVLTVFVSLCVCLCLCVVCVASNPPRCGAPGVCLFDWVCVSIWESVCLDCLYISVCLYIYVFTCVCLCACTYCKQSTTMPPVCVCDAVPHWCPKRPIGNLCRQWPRRSHAPLLADATPPLSCVVFCPFLGFPTFHIEAAGFSSMSPLDRFPFYRFFSLPTPFSWQRVQIGSAFPYYYSWIYMTLK